MTTEPIRKIPETRVPSNVPRVVPPTAIAGTAGRPSHMAKAQHRNRRRAPWIVLGVFAGLLVAVYAAGVVAFFNICYPHTSVAGVDVSLMNRETASGRISAAAKSYNLTVTGDGFNWSFKPESTDDILDSDAVADRVIKANDPFIWPVRLVQSFTQGGDFQIRDASASEEAAELPASFDKQAFDDSLNAAVDAFNANRTGTFDAAGAYDAEAGKFTLEKARSNQKLDRDGIEKLAIAAIVSLNEKVELDQSAFVPIANGATEEQLNQAIDAANGLIGTNVNLKMGGTVVATLDGKQLAQWMTFDDKLQPTLNTDMVTSWVRDLAVSTLDTVGSQRTYTRPDGKQITVSGGTYGWTSDEAALVKALQEAVANKQTGDIEAPTKQTGAVFTKHGEKDWGAYVDVDLTEQHARYYDASGNLVWESGCISGNPNLGNETPTGVYYLNQAPGSATLVGADKNGDGEPDYKTPVTYWMPFVGGAVGLHDADWQASSSFSNPQAFYSVGSHGCVNLPPAKARELAGMIHVGDCVIVHN